MEITFPLPDPLIELIARRFRIMGEPMRIKILDRLREEPLTVSELVGATGLRQQNVSKHLGVLHQAGIVSRKKEGNFVRYNIEDQTIFAICEIVSEGLESQAADLDEILKRGTL